MALQRVKNWPLQSINTYVHNFSSPIQYNLLRKCHFDVMDFIETRSQLAS